MLNAEAQGSVVHLQLNRPEQRNSLSLPLLRQLRQKLEQLSGDASCRAVVLTGAGSVFCAGADLKTFGPLVEDARALHSYFEEFERTVETLAALPLPTVVGIHGGCYGGGISLATACDQRIGDRTARFSLPPARLGVSYSRGDINRLLRAVGHATAVDMLIGVRQLDAEAAHQCKLLQYLCADGEAAAEALKLAEQLACLSLSSIWHSKTALNELSAGGEGDFSAAQHTEITEGVRALGEKRPARFTWHPAKQPPAKQL